MTTLKLSMQNADKIRIASLNTCTAKDGRPSSEGVFLATVSSESIVRIWDVLKEESYLLSLQELDEGLTGDKAVCVDYNAKKKVLAVGTLNGKLAKWKMIGDLRHESDWHSLTVKNIANIISRGWRSHDGSDL